EAFIFYIPPQSGTTIIRATEQFIYRSGHGFVIAIVFPLRIRDPANSGSSRNGAVAVVDNNGELHRIAGTAVLGPGFVTVRENGQPFLGNDALQLLVVGSGGIPLNGNVTEVG